MVYKLIMDNAQITIRKPTVEEFAQRYNIDLTPVNKPDIVGAAINALLLILIIAGITWWLRKDYKRFKEKSKLWIFVIEVVLVCILLIPNFIFPIFRSLLISLNGI